MSKLQNPQLDGKDVAWSVLDQTVLAALESASAAGKQIALVSTTVNSPSTLASIARFTAKYPTARHIQVDPISYSGIIEANRASFGKAVVPSYHFANAQVV